MTKDVWVGFSGHVNIFYGMGWKRRGNGTTLLYWYQIACTTWNILYSLIY